MLCGEINEAPIINIEHWARENDECARARFGHRGKRVVEVIGASGAEDSKLYPARLGGRLYILQHVSHRAFAVYPRMLERSHSGNSGDDLPQQLQAFRA